MTAYARIEPGVDIAWVAMTDGHGTCPALELELVATDGALAPNPTSLGEHRRMVIGARLLRLIVARHTADARADDITMQISPGVFGLVIVQGIGALALTDQRAIGVVWIAQLSRLAQDLDHSPGTNLVFSVAREHLPHLELQRRFGGGIKGASLHGNCCVAFQPDTLLNPQDRRFGKPGKHTLATQLESYIRSP